MKRKRLIRWFSRGANLLLHGVVIHDRRLCLGKKKKATRDIFVSKISLAVASWRILVVCFLHLCCWNMSLHGKRKEIYKYEAPWTVYAMNWSVRPDKRFRLALGSFVEEYNNKVNTFLFIKPFINTHRSHYTLNK